MAKRVKSKKSKKQDVSKTDPTRVITGVCRSSYMFIRELTSDDDSPKTCGTQVLIPKKDKKTVEQIEKAVKAAARKKFGNDVNLKGKKFHKPLRDGDQELKDGDLEGKHYKKHFFLHAKSYKIPQIVNRANERVEDPDELDEIVVSGYNYRFSLTFKGFETDKGKRGVRVILNNVMFHSENERLDGGVDAEEDFDNYAEDIEDDD